MMRAVVTRCLLGLACLAYSQLLAQTVEDDFSDGNFTSNPAWSGQSSDFTVLNGRLQCAPSGSGSTYLSTPFMRASLNGTEWRFTLSIDFSRFQGGDVSRVYLAASSANLGLVDNGMYVELNSAVPNELRLYRATGGGEQLQIVLTGVQGGQLSRTISVRARYASGLLELAMDPLGGQNYTEIDSATFSISTSSFLGWWVNHADAQVGLELDNVYAGPFVTTDEDGPSLTSIEALTNQSVRARFNEPLDGTAAQQASNYQLSLLGQPATASWQGTQANEVILSWAGSFMLGQSYALNATATDTAGNTELSSLGFTYLPLDSATYGEVVINEILANPAPVVGLPAAEFVELYNNSSKAFSLAGWRIQDSGGTEASLPDSVLLPGQHIILTTTTAAASYSSFGRTIGLSLPASWLNDASDAIKLYNAAGTLFDSITYYDDWYEPSSKAEGGWSLERRDPSLQGCDNSRAWGASVAPSGGTPGAENSLFEPGFDNTPPALLSLQVPQTNQVLIEFDGWLEPSAAMTTTNYRLEPGGIEPVVATLQADNRTVDLLLPAPLDSATEYTLFISGLADCPGNVLTDTILASIRFAPPLNAASGILLSEILYDPLPGSVRYVEVYNAGAEEVNLNGLMLARGEPAFDSTTVIEGDVMLAPGQLLALTADTQDVKARYQPPTHARLFTTARSMPAYSSGGDRVLLLAPDGSVLDAVAYSPSWQYPDLSSAEGVALERRSYSSPSQQASNWHSAASTVNYGTPGYRNSQEELAADGSRMGVWLEPKTFSPDNDGFQDLLQIHYRFNQAGYRLRIRLFNRQGYELTELYSSFLTPEVGGQLTWNGTLGNGYLPVGIYLIVAEAIHPSTGVQEVYRLPCVLAGRL